MAKKILIRTPNHLGDCVMALPMISETREAYPGSTVTVVTPEHLTQLFENNPAIDRILPIPTEHVHGLIAVFKIKEIISGDDFDVGYILPPSFGAAAGFKLAGVKERIGYIADGRRLLLTKPLALPTPLSSEHRSLVYFNLLRRSSGAELHYVEPKIFLNDDDTRAAADLLSGFGVKPVDEYAVVAFQAVAESRRWGTDNYSSLAKHLCEKRGLRVILVGTATDRPEGEKIVEAVGSSSVINLAGKTSLRELAAVASRAEVFVGNDSGPAHLAAAVGIPVVILSGADDPKETSPMSKRKELIYPQHLDCISCVKNRCPNRGDEYMLCMKEISPQHVTSAVDTALGSMS